MRMPSGVQIRGAVYWHRVTIPKDIQHLYPRTAGGKVRTTHSYVSLDTSDPAEAALRALRRRADLEAEFIATREKSKATTAKLTPTPELVRMLADRIRFRILAGDDSRRLSGVPLAGYPLQSPDPGPSPSRIERMDHQRFVERAFTDALGLVAGAGVTGWGRSEADSEAKRLGLSIDWAGHDAALLHLTRVAAQAYKDAAQRTEGALVMTPATPDPAAVPAVPGTPVRLADIVPDWKAKRHPSADALKRTALALRRLAESGMDKPINKYTKADGARLRDWLRNPERGIKHKTAQNLWNALGALMNVAAEYEKIERNPWAGMEFEVSDSGKRDEFTSEQIAALFSTTLFTVGTYRPIYSVQTWDAYYMLLLGLWTGSRIGEPAQLETSDVKVQNGIHVIAIHAEAEGSTLKTAESVRTLPVPPEMIRLGFLDFVEDQRRAGHTKLFPSLHRDGRRPPGEVMSEWVKGYRQDLDLPAGALNGFHKFRHTIRSALAAHSVGTEIADALTGHAAQGSAGRTIYTHVRPAAILKALELPLYPFLNLQRVYSQQRPDGLANAPASP